MVESAPMQTSGRVRPSPQSTPFVFSILNSIVYFWYSFMGIGSENLKGCKIVGLCAFRGIIILSTSSRFIKGDPELFPYFISRYFSIIISGKAERASDTPVRRTFAVVEKLISSI